MWTVRIAATEKGVPYKFTPLAPAYGRGRRHPSVRQDPGDAARRSRAVRVEGDLPPISTAPSTGPPLIPADAKGAALTEQWISCVNTTHRSDLRAPVHRRLCLPRHAGRQPEPGQDRGGACRPWRSSWRCSNGDAKTGHLVGDKLTLADINLFPIAFYLQRFPESNAMMQAHKHLTAFVERMLARPSVKATAPPPPPKKDWERGQTPRQGDGSGPSPYVRMRTIVRRGSISVSPPAPPA